MLLRKHPIFRIQWLHYFFDAPLPPESDLLGSSYVKENDATETKQSTGSFQERDRRWKTLLQELSLGTNLLTGKERHSNVVLLSLQKRDPLWERSHERMFFARNFDTLRYRVTLKSTNERPRNDCHWVVASILYWKLKHIILLFLQLLPIVLRGFPQLRHKLVPQSTHPRAVFRSRFAQFF